MTGEDMGEEERGPSLSNGISLWQPMRVTDVGLIDLPGLMGT